MFKAYSILFAAFEDFETVFPVPVTLAPDSSRFQCTMLDIRDDNIPEVREDLQMELRLVERDLAGQVRIPRSQVTIRIRDNDGRRIRRGDFAIDGGMYMEGMMLEFYLASGAQQLMFVGDTPVVDGNSLQAEFVMDSSFTSVNCRITGEENPIDCEI